MGPQVQKWGRRGRQSAFGSPQRPGAAPVPARGPSSLPSLFTAEVPARRRPAGHGILLEARTLPPWASRTLRPSQPDSKLAPRPRVPSGLVPVPCAAHTHLLDRRPRVLTSSARRPRLTEPLCLGFRAQIRGACAVRSLRVRSARGQPALTGSAAGRAKAGLDREGEAPEALGAGALLP